MIATKDKTFSDLNFLPHGNHSNAIQARLDLGYGFEISVVSHKGKQPQFGGLYGNASDGTYEVAVFHNHDMLPLSPFDDVRGWQDKDDLTELMGNCQGRQNRLGKCSGFVASLYINKRKARAELDLDSPHNN